MSRAIDLAVVTKKQQCRAYLLFRQCYRHQKKHGWRPLAGFPRSTKIRCPHLWALMPRWLHGKESGNDKIPRPSQQLHQQNWRGSTIWCILTSQSALKYSPLYQSPHMRVWKGCVGFEATENIFTKHDVTDEIDRTCLTAHSLLHGHWLWRNSSQICKASSKENGTGK